MRRLASRMCAALMALLILALSPAQLPGGCDRCPPDCPMHAGAASAERHDLPCHQGELAGHAADADCVVRAACGHDGAFLAAGVVRVLLPDVLTVPHVVIARAVDADATPWPAHDPREPLTAPPRPAVG
jgi:hypothetical protein